MCTVCNVLYYASTSICPVYCIVKDFAVQFSGVRSTTVRYRKFLWCIMECTVQWSVLCTALYCTEYIWLYTAYLCTVQCTDWATGWSPLQQNLIRACRCLHSERGIHRYMIRYISYYDMINQLEWYDISANIIWCISYYDMISVTGGLCRWPTKETKSNPCTQLFWSWTSVILLRVVHWRIRQGEVTPVYTHWESKDFHWNRTYSMLYSWKHWLLVITIYTKQIQMKQNNK